jgi:hypothetical protein
MEMNSMENGQQKEENNYEDPIARKTTAQDFSIPEDLKVGNYDPDR